MNATTATCIGGPLHGKLINHAGDRFRAEPPGAASCIAGPTEPRAVALANVVEYRLDRERGVWLIDPDHLNIEARVSWAANEFVRANNCLPRYLQLGHVDYMDARRTENAIPEFFMGLRLTLEFGFDYYIRVS